MPENRAPLSQSARAYARMEAIRALKAAETRVQLQLREQLVALVEQDTPWAERAFVADELSMELGESPGTCGRWLDDARALHRHPLVHALVDGERFTLRHADAMLDALAGCTDEVQEQVLALVLADEEVRTPYQLRKAITAALFVAEPDRLLDRQQRLHERRAVTVVDDLDGSASVWVNGTKTGAAEMLACIDAHVGIAEPGDTRTLGQRRYDFVHGLLTGAVSVTAPWQALIVVSLDTVNGGDAPAEVPGLGLVCADEARDVLARAELRRAVVDADGVLVSLDSTVHRPDQTPDQQPLPLQEPAGVEARPEPAVLDGLLEDEPPTLTDLTWLAQHEAATTPAAQSATDEVAGGSVPPGLCADGIRQLEAYLTEQATVAAGARRETLAGLGLTVTLHQLPPGDDPGDHPWDDPWGDPPGDDNGPGPPGGGSGPP